jgi:hypothetical protein
MKKVLYKLGFTFSCSLSIAIFVHHWIIYFITQRHNHFVGSILLFVVSGINALMGHYEITENSYGTSVAIKIALFYIPPIAVLIFIWFWLNYTGTIFYYTYTFVMVLTILIYMIAAITPHSNPKKKSLHR